MPLLRASTVRAIRGISLLALATACLIAQPAFAQDQEWDGGSTAADNNPGGDGGNGDWTVNGTNWQKPDGTANDKWQGGNARFGGPGGLVHLFGDHVFTGMVFDANYQIYTDTYTNTNGQLTAATGSLRTDGMSTITVATGVEAQLNAPITGNGGLTKNGDGTLYLNGPNFFLGNFNIEAGTVVVTAGQQQATGAMQNGRSVTVSGNDSVLRFEGGGMGGPVNFYNLATGTGGIIFSANSVNGSVNGGNAALFNSGYVRFEANSRAGGMFIYNYAGALLDFADDALPQAATINNSAGGTVRFSYLNTPTVTVYSLTSVDAVELDGKALVLSHGSLQGGLLDGGTLGGSGASLTVRNFTGNNQQDTAGVSLGGISTYTGGTFVESGGLHLDRASLQGDVLVTSGMFSGSGDVAGNVVIRGANSTLIGASGSNYLDTPVFRPNLDLYTMSMQTLTIDNGAHFLLLLAAPYPLGAPSPIGPFDVRANVALSGVLDIQEQTGTGFGPGLYRLITYGGSLSGSGLTLGQLPNGYLASRFTVQTSITGQVNLIVSPLAAVTRLFWDGGTPANANNAHVDGGSGIWNTTNTNWTTPDGASNGVMNPVPGFVIFAATPGTVTVSNTSGQVSVTGMQFASSGYSVIGDPILLSGQDPIVRVGDGTGAGAAYTATIGSVLTGTGGLVKTDFGTLILSGTNSYTGTTRVSGGTLAVNGVIAGPVIVENGASLRGVGRVGTTSILSGGTIAPGNSIGTITVAGNISFVSGALYTAEVAANGNGDRINATGSAVLSGGTVNAIATPGAYANRTRYTILNAGTGVSGNFSGVTSTLAYLRPTLSYDANNVYLTLSLDDQFSGELHSSLRTVLTDDSRFVREAALDRLSGGGGSGFWIRGIGAWGHWDEGAAFRTDRSFKGVLAGVDFGDGALRGGIEGGYTQSDIKILGLRSSASVDSIHVGAYLGTDLGPIALRAGGAYSWHDIDTRRAIVSGAFSDSATGHYDGETAQAFGEIAAPIKLGRVKFEPHASVAYVRMSSDGFAEIGGTAAVAGDATRAETVFTTVGLRGEAGFGPVTLRAGGGWRHAFEDRLPLTRIAFKDGSSFSVPGVPIAEDAMTLDASARFRLRSGLDIGVRYGGQIGRERVDHSVKAEVILRF